MALIDHKDRPLYTLILVVLSLTCLILVFHLRGFVFEIWRVIATVISPVISAIVIGYVLRPIIVWMVSRGLPRTVAILVVYLFLLLIIAIFLTHLVPMLFAQVTSLVFALPRYGQILDQVIERVMHMVSFLPKGFRHAIDQGFLRFEGAFLTSFYDAIAGAKSGFAFLINAFVVPFITYYLLKEDRFFLNVITVLLPKRYRAKLVPVMEASDQTIGKYVRGQLLVMVIIGFATIIGLTTIGMPYALVFGLLVGLFNIIPYVGPILGATPALVMAIGIAPTMIVKVLIVNVIVQQLESNLLSPLIMGKTMRLHPLTILLSVMVGGQVAGVPGLLFAVPIVAVIKVWYEHFLKSA